MSGRKIPAEELRESPQVSADCLGSNNWSFQQTVLMWNLLQGDRRACSAGGGKPAEARVGRAVWAEDFRVEFLSGIGSQPRERAKEKHLYSRNPRQAGEKAWWVRALAVLDKDLGSVSRPRIKQLIAT